MSIEEYAKILNERDDEIRSLKDQVRFYKVVISNLDKAIDKLTEQIRKEN